MIGIVDMDMGNLRSVSNAIYELGTDFEIVQDKKKFDALSHLIIPGVGAYALAMKHLRDMNLVDPIRQFAQSGKPVLGICLGMQILSSAGEEGGDTEGLNLIPGRVEKLDSSKVQPIPHVGWNGVMLSRSHPVFADVKSGIDFYFVHSYHFHCQSEEDALGKTECGQTFTSIVSKGNILGFQFHPEKSQANGLKLLENFADWNGHVEKANHPHSVAH